MLKRAFFLLCLWPSCLFSAAPYFPITANFELRADETQWHIVTKERNTPIIRCYFYQGTNAWGGTNWSARFKYAKDDGSTNMNTITGTVYTTTGTSYTAYRTNGYSFTVTGVTYATYADFQATTNTFQYEFNKWYSTVLLNTGDYNISQASGLITVKRSPEL